MDNTSVSIEFLQWDSHFFGLNIYRVRSNGFSEKLQHAIDDVKSKRCDLAYIEIPYDINGKTPIERRNLADIKVVYETSVSENIIEIDPQITILNDLSDDLYNLTLQSGHKSRYKTDSNFAKGEFERFYRTWIENSLNGQIADYVLGYVEGGRIIGMITLKLKDIGGEIGLFAVDSATRGKGIGRKLMHAAMALSLQNNKTYMEVATQLENTGACRFYENLGFKIKLAICIYHKWFNHS